MLRLFQELWQLRTVAAGEGDRKRLRSGGAHHLLHATVIEQGAVTPGEGETHIVRVSARRNRFAALHA